MNKGKISNFSGITLIALVITVIVLLILAGISISMLSGDNGILQKSTTAKENTERAEIIETAQLDILGKQAENHGSLSANELEEILISPDYKTQGTLSNEENILERTLTSKDGKYEILVSEIYRGTLFTSGDQSNKSLGFGSVNEEYKNQFGYLVTGYNAPSGYNWRLFYADSNNVYLISDYNRSSALRGDLSGFGVSEISELGQNLNSKYTVNSSWNLQTSGNLNDNIKAVAALLDTTKWTEYKTAVANWAIGAPTLEMFIASYNATHTVQIDCTVEANATGYKVGKKEETTAFNSYVTGLGITDDIDKAIYCGYATTAWWIASPSASGYDKVCIVDQEGSGRIYGWGSAFYSLRQLVSIPISKIKDGTITITNKYFNN